MIVFNLFRSIHVKKNDRVSSIRKLYGCLQYCGCWMGGNGIFIYKYALYNFGYQLKTKNSL